LEEVQEAIDNHADIIMLDNMDNETMVRAVKLINGRAKVEASGKYETRTGKGSCCHRCRLISIGALTHSVTP
jgi:nicotinate-nucleotide pyrophosphorylase (carboxylating)